MTYATRKSRSRIKAPFRLPDRTDELKEPDGRSRVTQSGASQRATYERRNELGLALVTDCYLGSVLGFGGDERTGLGLVGAARRSVRQQYRAERGGDGCEDRSDEERQVIAAGQRCKVAL
jgi:hypothetical protein